MAEISENLVGLALRTYSCSSLNRLNDPHSLQTFPLESSGCCDMSYNARIGYILTPPDDLEPARFFHCIIITCFRIIIVPGANVKIHLWRIAHCSFWSKASKHNWTTSLVFSPSSSCIPLLNCLFFPLKYLSFSSSFLAAYIFLFSAPEFFRFGSWWADNTLDFTRF